MGTGSPSGWVRPPLTRESCKGAAASQRAAMANDGRHEPPDDRLGPRPSRPRRTTSPSWLVTPPKQDVIASDTTRVVLYSAAGTPSPRE
jgi:hypothetical protein